MSTYAASVKYTNPVKEYTSSVMFGGTSLESTFADIHKELAYYRGMGYRAWLDYLEVNCQSCNGGGQIQKNTRRKGFVRWETCKPCRGTGAAQVLTNTFTDYDKAS